MANDDKEIKDYLAGNSELSQRYRAASKAEPSPALDEKIISAAREVVVSNGQQTEKIIRRPRWAVPVSIAAVITLSVSLVVTMQQETGQPIIREPVSEFYDIPDAKDISSAEPAAIDAAGMKQDKIESRNEPAPTTSMRLMDTYRADSDVQELKNEARTQAAKKVLSKEKVHQAISEDSVLAEEVLPAAPAESEVDVFMESENVQQRSSQEMTLLKIKTLWEEGNRKQAETIFGQFIENYPDYSDEVMAELIGKELLQILQSE